MDRINLTQKRGAKLPVTINGADHDLTIDIDDMLAVSIILRMSEDLADYKQKASEIKIDKNEKELKGTISKLRKFATEGIELCGTFSHDMQTICPEWTAVVGDNFVNLNTYEALILKLVELVNEHKAEVATADQMELER